MADQEQVDLLKQVVDIRNDWRKEKPCEEINFSFASLDSALLRCVNLLGADLSNASFYVYFYNLIKQINWI